MKGAGKNISFGVANTKQHQELFFQPAAIVFQINNFTRQT
jgi:hypothetical protein